MKILLIQPPLNPHVVVSGMLEPLGLEVLAATIAQHEIRILDMRLEPDLERLLVKFAPQVVGITAISVEVNSALNIAARVRQARPNAYVVVGGHHASLRPLDFNSPAIDAAAIGPAEDSFPALIRALEKGFPIKGIPGLAVREENALVLPSVPAVARHLNDVPLPRRDLTVRYRDRYWMQHWRKVALLQTTRGCPFRCNFCACWKLSKGKFHSRDPQKVVEDLRGIREKHVYFADDNTFLSPTKAEELYRLIKAAGIKKKYFGYIRADSIANHPELTAQWREIGLDSLVVGIESFRERDLHEYKKSGMPDDNEKAIRILQEVGIINYAHLIVRPDFTVEDFDALYRYVEREGLIRPVFPCYTPLPGTDLFAEMKDQLLTDNFDLYDLGHMVLKTRLPRAEFVRQVIRLWRRSYSFKRYFSALAISVGQRLGLAKNLPRWRRRRLPLAVLLWVNFVMQSKKFINKYIRYNDLRLPHWQKKIPEPSMQENRTERRELLENHSVVQRSHSA
jgi:radical SAM superfamily enzyme YgiQ (UPF0313 family)